MQDMTEAVLTREAITAIQARAVLDALPDGVALLAARDDDHVSQTGFTIEFVNRRLAAILREAPQSLLGHSLTSVFSPEHFGILHDAVSTVYATRQKQRVELDYVGGSRLWKLAIRVATDFGSSLSEHLIVTFHDRSAERPNNSSTLATDTGGIENVSVLETSRRDLENEIKHLRRRNRRLETILGFDAASGLLNRNNFLDRSAAEFRRALRYAHPLSLVIISLDEGIDDASLVAAAQCCESNCRTGIDILGRTADSEIAILLPETELADARHCAERLKARFDNTAILHDGPPRTIDIQIRVDGMGRNDYSFLQIMQRARQN